VRRSLSTYTVIQDVLVHTYTELQLTALIMTQKSIGLVAYTFLYTKYVGLDSVRSYGDVAFYTVKLLIGYNWSTKDTHHLYAVHKYITLITGYNL